MAGFKSVPFWSWNDELNEEELREMMKDQKYWKEQDPETVRKVEQAFQKKYGEFTQNSTNNVKNSHLFQGNEQKDHKIRSTNERWKRALDYAIDVIQTVAKMADKYSRYDSFEEQLKDIQAYCWQEGYILTHEEELNRAITKGGKDE